MSDFDGASVQVRKADVAERDGGFERQLRRAALQDPSFARNHAGLVVGDDDRSAFVVDAIGARRERERFGAGRQHEASGRFGNDREDAVAALAFAFANHARNRFRRGIQKAATRG